MIDRIIESRWDEEKQSKNCTKNQEDAQKRCLNECYFIEDVDASDYMPIIYDD